MEKEFKCKTLKASYKVEKAFLSGLHKVSFLIMKKVPINICIEQCDIRNILIKEDNDILKMNYMQYLPVLKGYLCWLTVIFSAINIVFSDRFIT